MREAMGELKEEEVRSTYVYHFHVFDHGIGEGKREDYLRLGSSNISIHRHVVHSIQ